MPDLLSDAVTVWLAQRGWSLTDEGYNRIVRCLKCGYLEGVVVGTLLTTDHPIFQRMRDHLCGATETPCRRDEPVGASRVVSLPQ